MSGDDVSEVMSQPAPASCIQVPMLDATDAIQRARKSGWRSGLHAESLIVFGRWLVITLSRDLCKALFTTSNKIEPPYTRPGSLWHKLLQPFPSSQQTDGLLRYRYSFIANAAFGAGAASKGRERQKTGSV